MNRVSMILVGIALVTGLPGRTSNAATLATYTFGGADPAGDAHVPVAPYLTFTPLSRVSVSAISVSEIFESANWTLAGTQNLAEYVQFTLAPDTGHMLSLTTLSFDVQRSVDKRTANEKDGPLAGQVRIYRGVGLTLLDSHDFSPGGVWQNVVVNLTDVGTGDGEPLTVRFYGWTSGHQNGWMAFDNVMLQGSISSAPEPSSVSLMAGGCLVFWLYRNRGCWKIAPGALC